MKSNKGTRFAAELGPSQPVCNYQAPAQSQPETRFRKGTKRDGEPSHKLEPDPCTEVGQIRFEFEILRADSRW